MTPLEAGAAAIAEADYYDWDELNNSQRETFRTLARACLTAAIEALSDEACWYLSAIGDPNPVGFRAELLRVMTEEK